MSFASWLLIVAVYFISLQKQNFLSFFKRPHWSVSVKTTLAGKALTTQRWGLRLCSICLPTPSSSKTTLHADSTCRSCRQSVLVSWGSTLMWKQWKATSVRSASVTRSYHLLEKKLMAATFGLRSSAYRLLSQNWGLKEASRRPSNSSFTLRWRHSSWKELTLKAGSWRCSLPLPRPQR